MGLVKSGFPVKNMATLDCRLADDTLRTGQRAKVSGTTSLSSLPLLLKFMSGALNESVRVTTDGSGAFSYSYELKQPGDWSLQALFGGDDLNFPVFGDLISFTVDREPTDVVCVLSSSEVKQNQPITVSGTVTPKTQGLAIEVTFASSASYHRETEMTDADGGFSCSFKPPDAGVWSVLAQVISDDVHYTSSQSDLLELIVTPIDTLDRVVDVLRMMITPPYQYVTISMAGAVVALAVFKGGGRTTSIFTTKCTNKTSKGKSKGRNEKRGQRYRKNKR